MGHKESRLQRFRIWSRYYFSGFSNIVTLVIIIYFLFIVSRSVYNSYQDHQEIEAKKVEITKLFTQVSYLENQNLYYQTASFKEKEARKKLGLIKPGESVVALDRESDNYETPNIVTQSSEIKEPNYHKWWRFYFGS